VAILGDLHTNRRLFFYAVILIICIVLLIRLFSLQVVDTSYRVSADNNVLRYVTQYPARGLIFDRNGKLLVYNQAAYDLMVIPGQTSSVDTTELCNILEITKESFNARMEEARAYSRYAPSVFLKMVSSESYGRLQEVLYKYPGFYVQTRTLRNYSYPVAAHVLGYVGEVNEKDIGSDPYYKMGDYIGVSGIEASYEKELRGRKGLKIFLVDVHNRIKGTYQAGRHDSIPVPGEDLISTLDIDLQLYGEKLMENKNGSIVALEPSTGEVLALITAPNYDPSLLIGRIRSENFRSLQGDTLEPLFNRALMASYPPGSTFKTINGLIGLQEGVISRNYEYFCDYGYYAQNTYVKCHHYASFNLPEAIMTSCNSYFCNAFRQILENQQYESIAEAYNGWRSYLTEFGFGSVLGTDLKNELPGFVPETSYYNRYYGEGGWKALTVLSLAIGQGELGATPLQMANMTASIANRGYYYTPHIIKGIANRGEAVNPFFRNKHVISIDSANFEIIVEGMRDVVNGGAGATARYIALRDIEICGKTGTAENPHGPDHSIFIAFAPAKDPKIALAVYVENIGFGATFAAPIASLMIEKYLKGEITNRWLEERILNPVIIEDAEEN